jgi:beta-lactamase regulating signal transducer with metallopeptidase domain
MSDFIDTRLEPALWVLADWSLRWGALIALVAIWFAPRPPRQAAMRLAVCQLVLIAGLALPFVPRWWGGELLRGRSVVTAEDISTQQPTRSMRELAMRPARAEWPTKPAPPTSPLAAGAEQDRSGTPAMISTTSSPEDAEPIGPFRIGLLIAAWLWCVGSCVQLARLIAGLICLSQLPRGACLPSPASRTLFDRCREEIGSRRPLRLGIHPTLTAPIFIGGFRPWVLVPIDWEQRAPEEQRAVFWHELGHAARRDDLAKFAEEAVRAIFFFHPLVHWLLNRVDAYREQVCDSAAVRQGVTGRMLAQILVDFSRRRNEPVDRAFALRPALPFFRRRTVMHRIHELLQEQTVARWSAPLVRRQLVGVAAIAFLAGVALGGFGTRVVGSPAEPLATSDDDSNAPTSTSEKATATTKVATSTLDRILTNWKAREERTRALHFEWESRVFFGAAAEARAKGKASQDQADRRSGRVSYWLEGFDRRRSDSVPFTLSPPNTVVYPKIHFVTNGATECRVEDPGNGLGPPVATLSPRLQPSSVFGLNPLTLTFHAMHAFEVNSQAPRFRVVKEDALIDGVHCVELQNANDQGTVLEKCWVDPARDDIVMTYEFWMRLKKGPESRTVISIQYQHDRVHGWVPARWTERRPGVGLNENSVIKYTINERFPEGMFSLNVAPGTVIFDMRTAQQYRAAAGGEKTDIVQFDSPASLKIGQALERITDFPIEPQSLKDAIDFISARYQIPIIIGNADFDAAGVDTTTEVVGKNPGIRVADLLKSLCAQLSKPIGFRIEDEVLKVSPKYTEQGALRVRPAPEPQKPETPRARKVRESLEQPVDFNVEPQSLKDALEYIEARYKITIVSDPVADELVKVRVNCPGIKLRSLLSILLEQCPGELAFKIDHDALKIYSKTGTR